MLKVRISNNADRETVIVGANETLRQAVAKTHINVPGNVNIMMAGVTLPTAAMDSTFEELGYNAEDDQMVFLSFTQQKNNA